MNIIVIGLGSMGRRRIRLLKQLDKDLYVTGVDSRQERREEAEREFGILTAESLDDELARADLKYDAAIVSTSPLSHAGIIQSCLNAGVHVFSELNLVSDGYKDNIALAKNKGVILFLSSTPMYRKEIAYFKKRVQVQRLPVTYQYHVGQYLPDWHPWENYQDFFVGQKRTNGVRELFAVEFPWLIDVFGQIKNFQVQKLSVTELKVDFPDTYQILLEHESGSMGMMQVDIVARVASRRFLCTGEEIYLDWGGTEDSLTDWDLSSGKMKKICVYENAKHQEGYSRNIVENAYLEELEEFIGTVEGKTIPRYSFEKDLLLLNMLDKLEAL